MWFHSIEDKIRLQGLLGDQLFLFQDREEERLLKLMFASKGDANQGQDRRPAVLMNNQKFLHVLRDEWTNGLNGSLPASDFTAEQRGRCKSKHSQRKVFWDCMLRLIQAGYTVQSLLHKINQVYPGTLTQQLSVFLLLTYSLECQILRALRKNPVFRAFRGV